MDRPRLLDLFCGAGGAAMGYYRAGFDVVGVDIKPMPRYPFEFHQGDALEYCAAHGAEFDAIHASPPCQAYSVMRHLSLARNGTYPNHPMLIQPTRDILVELSLPYVIENVGGASRFMNSSIFLCGTYFGLKVYRHRWFESNIMLMQPPHIPHNDKMPSPGSRNPISPNGFISVTNGVRPFEFAKKAMGIDWMDSHDLGESIPPAYTEFIGAYLIKAIRP